MILRKSAGNPDCISDARIPVRWSRAAGGISYLLSLSLACFAFGSTASGIGLDLGPIDIHLPYRDQTQFFTHTEDIDKVLGEFQAVQLNPDNFVIYDHLGDAHIFLKNYEEAITAFRQTIKLNPNFIRTYFILAESYLLNKDEDSALKTYDSLREIDKRLAEELYDW